MQGIDSSRLTPVLSVYYYRNVLPKGILLPIRRHATIMFTDVVGFTSIMEQSEREAMRIHSCKMKIVRKQVRASGGSLVKEMGDGTLSVFDSSPTAVATALKIQELLEAESFRVRIGIHSGSVLFEGHDVFGDTVNVASRLEQKAPAGGILVSREALSLFAEGQKPETVNLGLTRLKGLGRLLQIHCLGTHKPSCKEKKDAIPAYRSGQVVLSVFPFLNEGVEEDEFYAYGIYADLLADLGKADSVSVVPLTSLLKAMKSGESNESVAARFGSKAMAMGTIARNGSRINLSLTLKEIESDKIIWEDTWEEKIDDLPAIKGKLADSILKALGKNPEEYPGVAAVEVDSVSVYEKYLRAKHLWKKRTNREHVEKTRELLLDVIDREPDMIPARVILAETYRNSGDYSTDFEMLQEAEEIAIRTDNHNGLLKILQSIGVSFWMQGNTEKAGNAYRKAMCLAEENQMRRDKCILLNNMALLDCDRSLFGEALDKLKQSLNMSRELESLTGQAHSLCNTGLVYLRSGNSAEALEYFERSLQIAEMIRDQTGEVMILTNIGIIHNDLGEIELAYKTAKRSLELSLELSDKCSVCRALNNMGSAMLTLGEYGKAREHFTEALLVARAIGSKNMEGLLQTNNAILMLETGLVEEAEEILENSLEISIAIDDREGIVENRMFLSEILAGRGDYSAAINHLIAILDLCKKHRMTRMLAKIRTDLALTLAKSGSESVEIYNLLEEAQNTEIEKARYLPEIYWKWSETYAVVSAMHSTSPADRLVYGEQAIQLSKAARDELLIAAEKIQSEDYKRSFLNSIPLHRSILK